MPSSQPAEQTTAGAAPASASGPLFPDDASSLMTIRSLNPSITTISLPFTRARLFPIGGRCTIVRLASSSRLAVFSAVPLSPAVEAALDALSPTRDVAYLIAPDIEHHLFLSTWARAFPKAKIIGPAGLPEKRAGVAKAGTNPLVSDDPFAVVFRREDKLSTKIDADFDADFDYEFVDAHPNRELVFFHKPTRTLIQADLFFNLPPTEQYSRVAEPERTRLFSSFASRAFASIQKTDGDLTWTKRFMWYLMRDRTSFNESVRRIDAWDFDTVIPCHGDVMVGDGKERFRNVMAWHLEAAAKAAAASATN